MVAYGVGYTDDSYQLASAASEIWLNPLGAVLIAGPGGSNLYYKGLLDKLGVTANVYRVGTYKSAVEPFIRNDMSPEARQNYEALDQATLESWRQSVKQARPKANVDLFLKDMNGAVAAAGGDMAKAALAAGLVDKIGDRTAFEARLAELGGKDDGHGEVGFRQIKLASYIADVVDQQPTGPIGVVTIAGMIVDGKAGPGTAGGDTIAKEIESGIRDKGSRRSSSGSTARADRCSRPSASARRCSTPRRSGIPVVVSMGSVAASGGYWVATPADFIYAEPSTITGSIGVFGVLPSFQGTLQKLGIGADGVKTTPLSGEPDLLRGPSPEANRLIQSGVNAMYARFLSIVAASRHKTPQQVDADRAGAGVGRRHRASDRPRRRLRRNERGDRQGGGARQARRRARHPLPRAAAELPRRAGRDARRRKKATTAPCRPMRSRCSRSSRSSSSRSVLAEVRSILDGPSIQARCLECPAVAPVAVQPKDTEPARAAEGMAVLIRLARPRMPRRLPRSTGRMSRTAGSASRKPRPMRAEIARRMVGDKPGYHPWLVAEERRAPARLCRKLAVPDPRRLSLDRRKRHLSRPGGDGPRRRAKPADELIELLDGRATPR